MKQSAFRIEIWCGNIKPDKTYRFVGTRPEARTECRKQRIKGPSPIERGTTQIAHAVWLKYTGLLVS